MFQTASREATWDKEKNFDQEKENYEQAPGVGDGQGGLA